MFPPVLTGYRYTVNVPAGFQMVGQDPMSGTFTLLPPGSDQWTVPAVLQVRHVMPMELPMLLQNVYGLENPMVAMYNAASLGLTQITALAPARQEQMAQGLAHIREFDAVTIHQFPVRVMCIVLQGTEAAVMLLLMMNLYRWLEFIGPCLNFVASITLEGGPPATGQVQAVIDEEHDDQVEFQIVNPDQTLTPITALPTSVGNQIIINIDNSVRTGNINGTGVVVGHHSTAKVS